MNQSATIHDVAIVGGGFGGIAAAHALKKSGVTDFIVFESESGPGGTWRVNTYPGCEVDVPSLAYSFSFYRYDWPRTHALQPELERYAEDAIEHFSLRGHFRFGVRVTSAVWREEIAAYEVTTSDGRVGMYRFVIAALGLLSRPNYPTWPGLDEFEGLAFHTSDWPVELDLQGKKVAVVGTGSTSVQVVPAIADQVEKLYVFQRQPGWIEPKSVREYSAGERWMHRYLPGLAWLRRMKIFWDALRKFRGYDVSSRKQEDLRRKCMEFIDRAIEDPATRAAVTPDYPWGCKRPVIASTFYAALNKPNVDLVPRAVKRVTKHGVVDDDGVERDIDVLVMSTGFQATRFLSGLKVVGQTGQEIQDYWGDRPRAFLSVSVPTFPNFFILYGPNSNGGSSVLAQIERQVSTVRRAIKRVRRRNHRLIDTKPEMLDRYLRWIDHQLATRATAMDAGCTNYYHSESGANVTQWPRSSVAYWVAHRFFARSGQVFR